MIPPEGLIVRSRRRPGTRPRPADRGLLMEAEALTTGIWSMQDAPEDELALPDTIDDSL